MVKLSLTSPLSCRTDETVEGLAALSGDPRFAYDSYRRLIQMYGDIVLGCEHHDFEHALAAAKKKVTNLMIS